MRKIVIVLALLSCSMLFGIDISSTIDRVHDLVNNTFVKSIAGLIVLVIGFNIWTGNWEKGKTLGIAFIVGIVVIIYAKDIVDFIFSF